MGPGDNNVLYGCEDTSPLPVTPSEKDYLGRGKGKVAYVAANIFWWNNKDASYLHHICFSHWDLKQSFYLCCKDASKE